ncbi:hypothetical protein DRJ17_06095 [Candidatus Woesearchaeota archaeon]|nr:MAG: hypothetical protein DRJ17_06095 [Candidatus Woesearchaeota archaeon]
MAERNTRLHGRQLADSLAGSGLQKNAVTDALEINLKANAGLNIDTDQLEVLLEASKGLAVSASGLAIDYDDSSIGITLGKLAIKALGITNDMLAGSISDDKLVADYIQTSEVDDSSIEFAGGSLNVKALGITNDMLAGSIALSKLVALTANSAIATNASGEIVAVSGVSDTEIGYLANVTSDIQAQLNALTSGYSRRPAVINIVDNTVAPPTEVTGDRYILDETAGGVHADWDGASPNDIVEFDGSVWVATTPTEGFVAYVDSSDKDALFVDDGTPQWELRAVQSTSLADGKIWIGNSSGEATEVTMSGDVTITNLGVTSIGNAKVTNDMLAGSVALSKLVSGTSAQIIVADGSGIPSYVNMSGDVTISNAGVTAIGTGKVTNDMLAGSIDDSKLLADYIQTSEVDNSTIEFGTSLNVKADGITDAHIRLTNDGYLTARNSAGDGDISILKVNTSDKVALDATSWASVIPESALNIFNAPTVGKYMKYTSNGLEWVDLESAHTHVDNETPSGLIDGANTEYTIANTPTAGTVKLYLNGLRQEAGSGKDYTISGTTITFAVAPEAGDVLLADYQY